MKVNQGVEDCGYALMLVVAGVVIYMAQHVCVKYSVDAAIDFYGEAKVWTKAQIADIKNS